jgi:hypothetical protein
VMTSEFDGIRARLQVVASPQKEAEKADSTLHEKQRP